MVQDGPEWQKHNNNNKNKSINKIECLLTAKYNNEKRVISTYIPTLALTLFQKHALKHNRILYPLHAQVYPIFVVWFFRIFSVPYFFECACISGSGFSVFTYPEVCGKKYERMCRTIRCERWKKINLFKFSWLIRQCAASHRSEQQHWLSANTSTEGKSKIGRFCGIGWVRLEYPQNICQLLLLFVSERTQTSTSKPVECYTKISLIIMHHLFDSEKGNSRIYSYVTRYIVSQDANLPKLICVFFY